MALHGGRFENYYSRSTVTHIICSNLTDAKVKIFEKERYVQYGAVISFSVTSHGTCLQRF